MTNKKGVKKYHNRDSKKNLQIIFSRMQSINEERGLISRLEIKDNLSLNIQIDSYRDIYGCFSHISYLPKTPLMKPNNHQRSRIPRPSYDLSIHLRCEKRKKNQQYRNQPKIKVAKTTTDSRQKQMPYSVYITQTSMPPCWNTKGNCE